MIDKCGREKLRSRHELIASRIGYLVLAEDDALGDTDVSLAVLKECGDLFDSIHDFYTFLDEYLQSELQYLSALYYLWLEEQDKERPADPKNWLGDIGQHRIEVSLCRNLQDIPCEAEVNYENYSAMNACLGAIRGEFSPSVGSDYFFDLCRNFELCFFGLRIKPSLFGDLKKKFIRLGYDRAIESRPEFGLTSWIFYATISENIPVSIAANAKILAGKEFARSPAYILGVVNMGDIIRSESLKVIYKNKWISTIGMRGINTLSPFMCSEEKIKNVLARQLHKIYGLFTRQDALDAQDGIINEMAESVVAFLNGLKARSRHPDFEMIENLNKLRIEFNLLIANLMHGLSYALIDWAADSTGGGLIRSVIGLNASDSQKAQRYCIMSLSDSWFPDEDDPSYNRSWSILVNLLLSSFLTKEGTFDLESLADAHEEILEFLANESRRMYEEVFRVFHRVYRTDDRLLRFEDIVASYLSANPAVTSEASAFKKYNFLKLLMTHLQDHSPNGLQDFEARIEGLEDGFFQRLVNLLADISPAGKNSAFRRMSGEPKKDCAIEAIFGIYAWSRWLPDAHWDGWKAFLPKLKVWKDLGWKNRRAAMDRFEEIMEGRTLDAYMDYKSKPDPFIICLQEMLSHPLCGNIDESRIIEEAGWENIELQLKWIRDEIESNLYSSIDILDVNSRIDVSGKILTLLDKTFFCDGKTLREKIGRVSCVEDCGDWVLRLTHQTQRGFFDWNTVQAVNRYNLSIREEEVFSLWTVDGIFLRCLVEDNEKYGLHTR